MGSERVNGHGRRTMYIDVNNKAEQVPLLNDNHELNYKGTSVDRTIVLYPPDENCRTIVGAVP